MGTQLVSPMHAPSFEWFLASGFQGQHGSPLCLMCIVKASSVGTASGSGRLMQARLCALLVFACCLLRLDPVGRSWCCHGARLLLSCVLQLMPLLTRFVWMCRLARNAANCHGVLWRLHCVSAHAVARCYSACQRVCHS